MENIRNIIAELKNRGIKLESNGTSISYKAPKNSLTQDDLKKLKEYKKEIIELLNKADIKLCSNLKDRYKKFPLTPVQAAYWLGRGKVFEYGEVSCHIYLELGYDSLDIEKVEECWNKLIQSHDMLRDVIYDDGYQKILQEVPRLKILYHNYENDKDESVESVRERLGNKFYDTKKWPLFDIEVSQLKHQSILHFSMDFLIADWESIWLLLEQFEGLYYGEIKELPEIEINFRDYVEADRLYKNTEQYGIDKDYWIERTKSIPYAPQLPLNNSSKQINKFVRHVLKLDITHSQNLKKLSRNYGVTTSAAVMAVYASVLERWSQNSEFTINLTVLNRKKIHRDIDKVVGDFTEISLLPIKIEENISYIELSKQINTELFDILDHRLYPGVEVLRDIARERGEKNILMPYVFTSAVGLGHSESGRTLKGNVTSNGISQTPQVFIDCQMEENEGLQINWDERQGVFPEGLVDDMFKAFSAALYELATTTEAWEKVVNIALPEKQKNLISEVNKTFEDLPEHMLHEKVFLQAQRHPDKVCCECGSDTITYKEAVEYAFSIKSELERLGIGKGEKIGILLEKSVYQIPSVLGVLAAGGAFVPLDPKQGEKRLKDILKQIEAKVLLTSKKFIKKVPNGIEKIFVEDSLYKQGTNKIFDYKLKKVDLQDPAYIIFTSGSTGQPKGVVISHRGAVNTIEDLNQRYKIDETDSILGLSSLTFDLAIYDIFGILSVGGTIYYPDEESLKSPGTWLEMINNRKITIWNTVPATMQMLISYLETDKKLRLSSLKTVFLSGDWIPEELPPQIISKTNLNPQIICLGGATEASIWSVLYEYPTQGNRNNKILYGKPMKNQMIYVLDKKHRICPFWTKGELCIAGKGLALEYLKNQSETNKHFVYNEEIGEIIYRTGDIGYYCPDGNIKFCGRYDQQVKINGHRIELGDIESALSKLPEVKQSIAVVAANGKKEKQIIAYVEKHKNREVSNSKILEDLKQYLPEYMLPHNISFVGKFPLNRNGKIDRIALAKLQNSQSKCMIKENKELTPIEADVLQSWVEYGFENLSRDVNLYTVGADSLVMAQIAGKMKKKYRQIESFDALLRHMLNNPTIEDIAQYIENNKKGKSMDTIEKSAVYLKNEKESNADVNIYEAGEGPLRIIIHAGLGTMNCFRFLIPEMIKQNAGSVMTIAIKDPDVYFNLKSSETIKVLAEDYAAQVKKTGSKKVQIIGYCLAGWIAFEMANRLLENNIEIVDMVLLDSRIMPARIEDDLILEMLFLPNIYVNIEQIGFESEDDINNLIFYDSAEERSLNNGYAISLGGTSKLEKIGNNFRKLNEMTLRERFKWYVMLSEKNTGKAIEVDMAEGLFKSFCQSSKAVLYDPSPYVGNVRYLLAKDQENGTYNMDKNLKYWESLCLGKFSITEVPGTHITCAEILENAKVVASEFLNY